MKCITALHLITSPFKDSFGSNDIVWFFGYFFVNTYILHFENNTLYFANAGNAGLRFSKLPKM